MFKQNISTEERLLGELLENEAVESRPVFSESLHRRTMSAARQRLAAAPTVARRRPPVLAFAAAAACLLFALAIGWQILRNDSRQVPAPGDPQLAQPKIDLRSIDELADRTVGRLDGLTVSVALEPQVALLKHDARAVAGIFLDRLPIDPKLLADNQKRK
jgi:hypothetical protein